MKRYIARFEHDHGYSTATIEAPDIDTALVSALELNKYDYNFEDGFDVDTGDVDMIELTCAEESEEGRLVWESRSALVRQEAKQFRDALADATETLNALLMSDGVNICSKAGAELDRLDARIRSVLRRVEAERIERHPD